MTVLVPSIVPQTYSDLQAAVQSWVHRTDLASAIPGFIQLAEAKMSRRLRLRQQEAIFPLTASDANEVALPFDFAAAKTLWVPGYERTPLSSQSLETVVAAGAYGLPTMYAVQLDALRINGSGSVTGVYYAAVPTLSEATTTSWLLTLAPDLYIAETLAEALLFIKDEARAAMWQQRADALVDELNSTDQRDRFAGRLVARAR
jgi:hypothetical protein